MSERAIPDSRRRRIRRRLRRNPGLTVINDDSVRPVTHSKQTIWGSLDKPLLGVVILLLTIGSIMVFSSTFDWSRTTHGTGYGFFVEQHLRNVGFAVILMTFFAVVDYRFWKRFAILLLLFTLVSLVAVLAVGEPVFGARRSFIGGRFQPGELAELTIVIYMAAWLSAKKTRVDSIFHGLLPFLAVVGVVAALIVAQPDLSSAAIVVLTASVMFFVAGANLFHLGALAGVTGVAGLVVINIWSFSQTRIANFLAGLSDITSSDYHTQQAIVAFLHGGWFGVGLGQSQQKFGALPAPHTDSIFAIIGEELGVFGAAIVVTLYIFFAIRGFQMGRLARDNLAPCFASASLPGSSFERCSISR